MVTNPYHATPPWCTILSTAQRTASSVTANCCGSSVSITQRRAKSQCCISCDEDPPQIRGLLGIPAEEFLPVCEGISITLFVGYNKAFEAHYARWVQVVMETRQRAVPDCVDHLLERIMPRGVANSGIG